MKQQMNLSVKRGCTLESGKIFSVNESVPSNITYAQLMAGIEEGTYTLKSLAGKIYEGQVRERPNTPVLANLVFDTTEDFLTFSIPAAVTGTWPNDATTVFYDVFETDTNTGKVREVVYGNIQINAAITKEA
jgi:hypothetical protein